MTARLAAAVLCVSAGLLQAACRIYCGTCWNPRAMTLSDPDVSWACWLYCSSLGAGRVAWPWAFLADAGAACALLAAPLFLAGRIPTARRFALAGGILLLPIGLLALLPALFIKKVSY